MGTHSIIRSHFRNRSPEMANRDSRTTSSGLCNEWSGPSTRARKRQQADPSTNAAIRGHIRTRVGTRLMVPLYSVVPTGALRWTEGSTCARHGALLCKVRDSPVVDAETSRTLPGGVSRTRTRPGEGHSVGLVARPSDSGKQRFRHLERREPRWSSAVSMSLPAWAGRTKSSDGFSSSFRAGALSPANAAARTADGVTAPRSSDGIIRGVRTNTNLSRSSPP
jgi:hypothetical protein